MERVKQSVRQIIAMSYGITGLLTLCFILFRYELLGLFTTNMEAEVTQQVGACKIPTGQHTRIAQ